MPNHKSGSSLQRGLSFRRGDEESFTVSSPPPPSGPQVRFADAHADAANTHHRRATSNVPRVRMPKPHVRYSSIPEHYSHDSAAYRPRDTSGNFIQPFNFSMSSGLDVSSLIGGMEAESESDPEKPVPPPHRVPTTVISSASRPQLVEPESYNIEEQFSALGLYDLPYLNYDAAQNEQTSLTEDTFLQDVEVANKFAASQDESHTFDENPLRLMSLQAPPYSNTLPGMSHEEAVAHDPNSYDPYSGFYAEESVEDGSQRRSTLDESPSDQYTQDGSKLFSPDGTEDTRYSDESLSIETDGDYRPDYDYFDIYSRPLPSPPTSGNYGTPAQTSTPTRTASLPCHAPRNSDIICRSHTNPASTVYDAMSSVEFPIIPITGSRVHDPSKLSSQHFKSCREPWACSAIVAWLKDLFMDDFDLKRHTLVDATVALFTHKVPTMTYIEAESLSQHLVQTMLDEGVLAVDEEWLKFEQGTLSGVIPQLTGKGCYGPRLHDFDGNPGQEFGRCYSRYCTRALKKLTPSWNAPPNEKEWHVYWQVTPETMKDHSKMEINRQNNLHEVIAHSERIVRALNILLTIFAPRILQAPISKTRKSPIHRIFRKGEVIRNLYKENLIPRLKYRQKEQGPFITSISDILRDFIRTGRAIHIDYAGTYSEADWCVKREVEDNVAFDAVLKGVENDALAERLSYKDCSFRPVTFLVQLKLIVEQAWKNTEEDEEKTNLRIAIDELQELNDKINRRIGEKQDQHSLNEFKRNLVFRDNVHRVSLGLDQPGRTLLYMGSFSRTITQGFRMTDVHVAVLDNYMILYKDRDLPKRNEVNRPPIPISLLVLESDNDEAVVKTSMKGLVPVSNTSAPKHHHPLALNSSLPSNAMTPIQRDLSMKLQQLPAQASSQQNLLYPFRIKHLGQLESHVLYASDPKDREKICRVITKVKEDHLSKIQRIKAEPFRLRVLCNSEFRYPDSADVPAPFVLSNTALHAAIEKKRGSRPPTSRELPICCANINCATTFTTADGKVMIILGTDTGLYMSGYSQTQEWHRLPICAHQKVAQISVLEEFNLFIALVDSRLISYDLDKLAQSLTATGVQSPPRKLSKRGEVDYFSVGSMKDRVVLVYKRRAVGGHLLEMLEPVVEETQCEWPPFRTSRKEGFRLFNTFNASSDYSSVSIFNRLISVTTTKGIAIMNPDSRDILCVVPTVTEHDPPDPDRNAILNTIRTSRPLTMLRYDPDKYLLIYTGYAVMIDKYGQLNNCILHRFAGHAPTAVCIHTNYLIVVYDDLVEIVNAIDGRQRQLIAGRNIRLIDDGGNVSAAMALQRNGGGGGGGNGGHPLAKYSRGKSTGFGIARRPKIAMQNPMHPKQQTIVELIEI